MASRPARSGPIWDLPLETYDPNNPLLSQLAWHASLESLYAVTGSELVRIQIDADCSPHVVWRKPLGTRTENGSPTIEGDTIWFAVNGTNVLDGYDARTGERLTEAPLGATTLEAPTIVDHSLVVGTFDGLVEGFSLGPATVPAGAARPGRAAAESSWTDARHGWQSRASGVFATDDAGKSWRRIYAEPALAVARVSRTSGLIDVGLDPGRCMCTTRKLWTADGGRTWRATTAIGDEFTSSAGLLYWWQRGALHALTALPGRQTQSSDPAVSVSDGVIVGAAAIPDGIVALVSSRVRGQGWDTAPRVVVMHGVTASTVTLPATRGRPLATAIAASWPKLTVTATDYGPDPSRTVTWSSVDGGATWSAVG